MSDLLIKNMELPEDGLYEVTICGSGRVFYHPLGEPDKSKKTEAIELPTHGDLIDGDPGGQVMETKQEMEINDLKAKITELLYRNMEFQKANQELVRIKWQPTLVYVRWNGRPSSQATVIDDPVKFRTIMEHLSRDKKNPAAAHEAMDDYMCKVLEQLGYTEGVKFFKASDRCYA